MKTILAAREEVFVYISICRDSGMEAGIEGLLAVECNGDWDDLGGYDAIEPHLIDAAREAGLE
jgi:hypothetical protein